MYKYLSYIVPQKFNKFPRSGNYIRDIISSHTYARNK